MQKSWTPYSNHDSNVVRGTADNNQGDGIKLQVVVRPLDAPFIFTLNFVAIGRPTLSRLKLKNCLFYCSFEPNIIKETQFCK